MPSPPCARPRPWSAMSHTCSLTVNSTGQDGSQAPASAVVIPHDGLGTAPTAIGETMRRIIALSIAALALAGCSSAGSSSGTTQTTSPAPSLANATNDCNQAIVSDKVVTTEALKACNTVNASTTYKCLHGPSVYEVSAGTVGDPTLLRVGYKPEVYTASTTAETGTFYVSETKQLCGDPIDPSLTAPVAPLTQSQVEALFQPATSTTAAPVATPTTVPPAAISASCAQVFAQYGSVASNASNTISAPIATLIANACSPAELQTYITQYLPAAYTAMGPYFTQKIESMICPAHPHTKLCP